MERQAEALAELCDVFFVLAVGLQFSAEGEEERVELARHENREQA